MRRINISNHFKKQLAFNILFISAIILTIWVVALFFSVSYSKNDFNSEMQSKVDSSARELDSIISTLQTLSMQASMFSWSDNYAEEEVSIKNLDSLSLNRNKADIIGLKALSPVIRNISLVFPKGKIVISDYGVSTLDEFWQETFSKEVSVTSPYITSRNTSSYSFIPSIPTRGNTSLFTKAISFDKKMNIFIFLDNDRIMYELYSAAGLDSVSIRVYDKNKNEVFKEGSSLSYNQNESLANQNNTLIFRSTTTDGWIVEFSIPKMMLEPMVSKNMLLVTLAMLILELLSLPASYLLSQRNYKPVKDMIHAANGTDYQVVLDLIEKTFRNPSAKEADIDIYKPLLITALINKLRSPGEDIDSILQSLKQMGFDMNEPFVRLIAFSKAGGEKILEDEGITFVLIDQTDGRYKYILNGSAEKLQALETRLRDENEENIYISLSEIYSTTNPAKAFSELDDAMKHRSTMEDSYVLSFREISSDLINLDFSSLKSLELAIKAGKSKEAHLAVGNFFYENIKEVMTIDSLMRIKDTLQKFFSRIIESNELTLSSFESFKNWDIDEPDSITKLMETTDDVSQDILREMKDAKTEENQKELEQILKYLNEHISDPSISLSTLADRFATSESSISRIIRQLTGSGFLDYINSARIEKACELLKESEMNINSIALSVGYTNDITFRRLFKKINGVSPSEYRVATRDQR